MGGEIFVILCIVLLVFLIPNIIDKMSKDAAESKEIEKERQERERISNEFNTLVEIYKESERTIEILNYICDGDYTKNLPETIEVAAGFIRSTLQGCMFTYDFEQRRMYSFVEKAKGCDWKVNPKKAMAEAINLLMCEQYNIHTAPEGGQVYMKLKPTKNF